MRKILVLMLLPLLLSAPVQAASDEKSLRDEILYRVNLGRADDVKLLLERGANVNMTNDENVPLISLAANRTDAQVIKVIDVLLEAGADINAKDTVGQTALFHAAKINNKDVVLHLMDKGIDYYIVDNNGDIARNMAHKEGYNDLVAAMDEFVVEASKKVNQQYQEYNQMLQERFNTQKRIVEEFEKEQKDLAETGERLAIEEQARREDEYKKAQAKLEMLEMERQRKIIDKRNTSDFIYVMQDIAYNMCSFQYWSYCRNLKQTTEIKGKALDSAIDIHYDAMSKLSAKAIQEFTLEQEYINSITERAQKRIYYELENMPSKTYRFQNGVGKLKDARERCARVAKYWNMALSEQEQDFSNKHEDEEKR